MDVEGRFTFVWEIENFDIFLLANAGELVSAAWKTETADGDALWWSISIRHFSTCVEVQLVCLNQMLSPDKCDIDFKSSSCGEIGCRQSYQHGRLMFFHVEKNFFNSKKVHSIIDDQDTVTLHCKMKKKAMKNGEFRIHSVIKKVDFSWYINDPPPPRYMIRPTHHKNIFNEDNLLFNMSLDLKSKTFNACAELLPIIDGCFSFVDCKLMHGLINGLPRMTETKHHGTEEFNSMRTECKETIVVPNDTRAKIIIRLESIVIHHNDCKSQIFPTPSRILKAESIPEAVNEPMSEDFLRLYRESILSDATIHTEGKSFSAHRNILAARSPVFRAMFEKDETIEGRSGVVDIDDVDSETVDRLLVFLYGDSLGNMQWEEASALYYAADKYAVHTLKQKCADILKAGLTVDNVCDALVLADTHSDEHLMKCAVDFIFDHQRVVSFPKFEQLEDINPRLTSKVTKELFLKRGKK